MTHQMMLGMSGVGIIPETDIRINGLTVISGLNGTGKSTILKTLYVLLEPSRDLDSKIRDDSRSNIMQLLMKYLPSSNPVAGDDQLGSIVARLDGVRDRMTPYDRDLLASVAENIRGGNRDRFHAKAVELEIGREFGSTGQFMSKTHDVGGARVRLSYAGTDRGLTVNDGDVSWDGPYADLPTPIYYDDPFVMEDAGPVTNGNHRSTLTRMLHTMRDTGVTRGILDDARGDRFGRAVGRIVPGRFSLEMEGLQYTDEKGVKLDCRNLATGMKVFSILKILVSKGHVNENTVLLLDEPEIHLHPQWINELAAIICILVKDIGARVVMTTHNPQLLMALEGYGRDCGITMDCYNLSLEGEDVRVEDVTGDMGPVYRSMSAPIRRANSIFLGE